MSHLGPFEIAGLLLIVTALLAWINVKTLRLPTTIGVMVLALVVSLALVALANVPGLNLVAPAKAILGQIDFETVLLDVMLAFLLFAGSLHVNFHDLRKQGWPVLVLATLGVVTSTLVVGTLVWLILPLFGESLRLRFVEACLFGALITPTDPIAVLGLMKRAGVPKSLELIVSGESLFNDGVGVVVFLTLLGLAYPGAPHGEAGATSAGETPVVAVDGHGDGHGGAEEAAAADVPAAPAEVANTANSGSLVAAAGKVALLFLIEVGGGLGGGLVAGYVAYQFIRRVDAYNVEILITLALCVGTYAICGMIQIAGSHFSGPLAMVVAGLFMGNEGRATGMSDETREHVDTFWELIDEVLNALLFVLIGLEVLVLTFTGRVLLAGLSVIPLVLLARTVSVYGGAGFLHATGYRHEYSPGTKRVLIWAGLRGGISVALALAVPQVLPGGGDNAARQTIVAITYAVVTFSIVVQGLTVPWVVRRSIGERAPNRPLAEDEQSDRR